MRDARAVAVRERTGRRPLRGLRRPRRWTRLAGCAVPPGVAGERRPRSGRADDGRDVYPARVASAAVRVRGVPPRATHPFASDAGSERPVSTYLHDLDSAHIPAHVGIVMDGNGRWAKQQGLRGPAGHAAGEAPMFDTVEGGVDAGLRWLTLFAFSTENWSRPSAEVAYLMGFNRGLLRRRRDELNSMN